ncbi:MAG TPA: HigA family addiction module antitoxin [Sphingobium sp.]|uniref:HigA family addiction module antitoxin n=1 Tax=Sphingobium sp. TaxID=1912891 RepID=UPI002ED456EA
MEHNSPDYKTPGQLIEGLLAALGWSKRTLAVVLGVDETTVNRWTSDKQAINAAIALSLEEVLDTPAERFLALQREYDLAKARFAQRPDPGRKNRLHLFGGLPISEMIKRGWIDADDIRDVSTVERGLTKFFGVSSPDEIEILPHAAKKTMVASEPTPTQLAWLYRVKTIASELLVPKYSATGLEGALKALKVLTEAPEEARKVPRILAECGIRFVIVESLPSAKIDGVCFWLDDVSPVVGLSMRHDRIDNFWFVLRHELEHVRQGHGKVAMILDTELEGARAGVGDTVSEEERVANEAASNFCIPTTQMDGFIARKAPFFSERDLIGFARTLGVHPGLVAGQLQHRTQRYDRFRQHLVPIRSHVITGAAVDGFGNVYPVDE